VVLGEAPPTNEPQALRALLAWWQDNFASPPPPASAHTVSGRIHYDGSGLPVANVDVEFSGGGTQSTRSDLSGGFTVGNLDSGDWLVMPSKAGDDGGAVSAYDASMLLRAILGLETLSPLAVVACDTTGNGTLSALDAVRILQRAVGSIAALPVAESCGSDWVFAPVASAAAGQHNRDPVVSAGQCAPGAISFQPLAADHQSRDFDARLFGDCSGNWTPPNASSTRRSRDLAVLRLGRPRTRGRRHFEVPIWLHARSPLHSLDLRIAPVGGDLRARYRPVAVPDGALIRQRRARSGAVAVALASGRALQRGSIRVGSLIVRAPGGRLRLRRRIRVEARADDVSIEVRVPR
jgi:hypothetical protein